MIFLKVKSSISMIFPNLSIIPIFRTTRTAWKVYSVRIRENTDQKNSDTNIFYAHFLRDLANHFPSSSTLFSILRFFNLHWSSTFLFLFYSVTYSYLLYCLPNNSSMIKLVGEELNLRKPFGFKSLLAIIYTFTFVSRYLYFQRLM